jgi:sugar (pentulose or hexulose) kinase
LTADLVVGLDVGTTGTKCLVCDTRGAVVSEARCQYELTYPRQGWVEQDAEDLWRAVATVLREATGANLDTNRILALSLSSQGGTLIPADRSGQPLRPAISWLDGRAEEEGQRLADKLGQEAIYRTTGWEVSTWSALLLIPWLCHHEPAIYRAAERYLFVNDFIIGRLTGAFCMNPSDAAMTMLYDVAAGAWDEGLCAASGVRAEQLSPISDSGQVAGRLRLEVAQSLGLPPGVLVVNGGHDQYCAALGAGVVEPGDMLLSCGTAWVLLSAAAGPLWDAHHTFAPGRHVVPGRWGLLASIPTGGGAMEWLARNVLTGPEEGRARYDLLDRQLADPIPGAKGLQFLPLLSGLEAATGGSGVWGALTGLSLAHTRWDLAQGLMEGVAYELRWLVESLQSLGYAPRILRMVGGATRSHSWPQIVSDVTGLVVSEPPVVEAAAYGAARLAASAVDPGEGASRRLAPRQDDVRLWEPRPGHTAVYTGMFERFKATYRALEKLPRAL